MPKKKKPEAKVLHIEEDVFMTKLTVIVGSEEEIINTFSMWMAPEEQGKIVEKVSCGNVDAEYLQIEANNSICGVVFIKKDCMSDGLIAHELFHAVCASMRDKGIPKSDDTEEIFAYLLGFYINEFNKLYKKGKK